MTSRATTCAVGVLVLLALIGCTGRKQRAKPAADPVVDQERQIQ